MFNVFFRLLKLNAKINLMYFRIFLQIALQTSSDSTKIDTSHLPTKWTPHSPNWLDINFRQAVTTHRFLFQLPQTTRSILISKKKILIYFFLEQFILLYKLIRCFINSSQKATKKYIYLPNILNNKTL